MRHTLWTGISETNVNIITSATRTHAFNNKYIYIYIYIIFMQNSISDFCLQHRRFVMRSNREKADFSGASQ